MKAIIVLPAAKQDIGAIWDYSAARWGRAKADNYVASLSQTFGRIADGTANSRSAADVKPGLLRISVGRHLVFFRETKTSAIIVRVLHQSMDAGRWIE